MSIAPLEALTILVILGVIVLLIAGLLGWRPLDRSSDDRSGGGPAA